MFIDGKGYGKNMLFIQRELNILCELPCNSAVIQYNYIQSKYIYYYYLILLIIYKNVHIIIL